MNAMTQAASTAGGLLIVLLIVVYLSVGIGTSVRGIVKEPPSAIRLTMRLFREPNESSSPPGAGTILAVVMACLLQLVPIAIVASPQTSVSLAARAVAVLFFIAEGGWFVYLRRYLVH